MSSLNQRQQEAVKTIQGPVLVIAGPGTGKTKTLVERVLYLISECGVRPDEITVTTFTRKAAAEVQTRVGQGLQALGLGDASTDLTVGNFHSLSRAIIEDNLDLIDWKRGFRTIDEIEQQFIILKKLDAYLQVPGVQELFGEKIRVQPALQGNAESRSYAVKQIASLVDDLREKQLVGLVRERASTAGALFSQHCKTAIQILNIYLSDLKARNSIDHSGTLSMAVEILENSPQALQKARARARFLMVDEHQDTNVVQDRLIEILSHETKNLFVVGDDDQSLYRFRGAEVDHFLRFAERHPGTKVIELDTNYRSDGNILAFAEAFIANAEDKQGRAVDMSKERFAKHLKPADPTNYKQNAVLQIDAENTEDWVSQMLGLIEDLHQRGVAYNQIALLSSSLGQDNIRELQKAIREKEIGVYIPKDANVMSQRLVKLLFGLYAWVFAEQLNQRDNDHLKDYTRSALVDFKGKTIDEIKQVTASIRREIDEVGLQPVEIGHRLLSISVLRKAYENALSDGKEVSGKYISQGLQLIENFSYQFKTALITKDNKQQFVDDFFFDYLDVLRNQKIKIDDDTVIPDENTLSMMTIHQSKGMEYPVVIVMGLQSGPYYPYNSQLSAIDRIRLDLGGSVADENLGAVLDFSRKMYTAFTRAKNLLVLAGMRNGYRLKNDKAFAKALQNVPVYRGSQSLDGLRFDKVSDVKVKKSYSYTTHIEIYESCPLRYFFLRDQQVPQATSPHMRYGTLVHTSIDEAHKRMLRYRKANYSYEGQLEGVEKELPRIVRDIAEGMERNGGAFDESAIARAEKEVRAYFAEQRGGVLHGLFAAEEDMQIAKEEYILRGQIDMIARRSDGTYDIVDFKTGMPPDAEGNHPKLQAYKEQLLTYQELLEKGKEASVNQLMLYFTDEKAHPHLLPTGRQAGALEARMQRTDETVSRIEARAFDHQTMDLETCRYCPMRFYCGREVL